MKNIQKILVANRGEIALRIMKTARRMGISCVAIYSDVDANALHVQFADEAICVGEAAASHSYLNIDKVLAAAKATGCDAIHPGYGFSSENPDFAQAVLDANLIFIGPSPSSIRAMGLKREAKALVAKHGVPLVPGFDGGDQLVQTISTQCEQLGFPVILKPSAGGGGKGMRIVREAGQLVEAIESAKREASKAFSNDALIIEKYLESPRHIEVQVFGDEQGHLVHLFERECSIQRRHQKLIEESPSTALTHATRTEICEAALRAAKAVNYVNAGTVEFILDSSGKFYFSEMNTRLQVEHRVTEMVLGVDLVEWQIRVARGERLPKMQPELVPRGHAVEVRVCAENPTNQFFPEVGTVTELVLPTLGNVIVDSAIERGSEVSVHYDSMLAKVIAWGENREDATHRAAAALKQMVLQGVTSNQIFLRQLLLNEHYLKGHLSTQFIESYFLEPKWPPVMPTEVAAATLFELANIKQSVLPNLVPGFRNNRSSDHQLSWIDCASVSYRFVAPSEIFLSYGDLKGHFHIVSCVGSHLVFVSPDGIRRAVTVSRNGNTFFVNAAKLVLAQRFPPVKSEVTSGSLMSPMPGKILKVAVKVGDVVEKNQVLLVLEAMKMEQTTRSPRAGTVTQVAVKEHDFVGAGQVLVTVE